MKSLMTYIVMVFLAISVMAFKPKPCGKYQGRNIYKGTKGGCYYLKGKNHVKVYIDKKHCKC